MQRSFPLKMLRIFGGSLFVKEKSMKKNNLKEKK